MRKGAAKWGVKIIYDKRDTHYKYKKKKTKNNQEFLN